MRLVYVKVYEFMLNCCLLCLDWRQRKAANGMASNGMGTIQPFTKPQSGMLLTKIFQEMKNLLRERDSQVSGTIY